MWLCPPSQIFCLTTPTPTMHGTLSKHCCFRNTANILLTWSTFPRSPNVLPHLSGLVLQGHLFLKGSLDFTFFFLSSLKQFIWPCLTLGSLRIQSADFSGPGLPFPSAPHCLQQSRVPNCHSAVSLVDWQKVTDISSLVSLPPTQRPLGYYSHESVLFTWIFLCNPISHYYLHVTMRKTFLL